MIGKSLLSYHVSYHTVDQSIRSESAINVPLNEKKKLKYSISLLIVTVLIAKHHVKIEIKLRIKFE